MSDDADEKLDAMIRKIRAVPGIAQRAAPDVADAFRDELVKTIQAGTTPEGTPWKPRKADGGRALVGAEKELYVAPVGNRVLARIAGHIGRHHHGRVKGGLARPLLPKGKLPPAVVRRVRRELVQHFNETVKGG